MRSFSIWTLIAVLILFGAVDSGFTQGNVLVIGDSVSGSLTGQTEFEVQLDNTQAVLITVASTDFNTKVEIFDKDGNLLEQARSSASSRNTNVEFLAPASDTYTIVVSSARRQTEGDFTLTISPAGIDPDSLVFVGGSITDVTDGATDYTVLLTEGETVQINLSSVDFNVIVELYDGDGNLIGRNDDAAGNLNARLQYTPPTTGYYTIGVRDFRDNWGRFTLTIEEARGAVVELPVDITDVINGGITYELPLEAGQAVVVSVSSDAFDPILRIRSSEGEFVGYSDNVGNTTDALIGFTAQTTTRYQIEVSSNSDDATGEFDLTVVPLTEVAQAGVITVGETITRIATDEVVYEVSLTEGQTVIVSLRSGDFQPDLKRVYLNGRGHIVYEEYSRGMRDLGQVIEFTAPEDGVYLFAVDRSVYDFGWGVFTLSVLEVVDVAEEDETQGMD